MKACVEVKEVPLTVQLLIPKGEEKKKRLDSFPSTQEEGEEEEKAVDSSFNLILFINPAFLRNDRREGEEEFGRAWKSAIRRNQRPFYQNNNNPASICHQNRLKRFNRIEKKE